MNKTNNNLINYALGILGFSILSVMFVVPMHANAGYYTATSGMVLTPPTTKTAPSTSTTKPTTTTKTTTTKKTTTDSGLAANALFGANNLIPTTFLEWLMFLTLVFIIVVLLRRAFVKKEEKHETHEVHPVQHA